MSAATFTLPKHLKPRREKVFGFARGFAHDRNARVRIMAHVKAWNAKHKRPGQHQGSITASFWPICARICPGFGLFITNSTY